MKLHCATSSSLARAAIVVAGASGAFTLGCLSQLDALCGGNDHGVQEQLLEKTVHCVLFVENGDFEVLLYILKNQFFNAT